MDKQDEALKLLKDIRHITRQIELVAEEIEKSYTRLTNTTVKAKQIDVQVSLPSDPMADGVIQLVEYQKQMDKYRKDLIEKRSIFFMVMGNISAESQVYLTLRYLQNKSVEEIGDEQGYGYRRSWDKLHDAETEFIETYLKFA